MKRTLVATARPVWLTAGDDAWQVFTFGDFLISLEWDEDNERVMLFHNAHRQDGRAWGIADSILGAMLSATGTFERNPDPTPILVRGLLQLDRETSRNEIHLLMDAISHTYPYLHNMPPTPLWLKRARRPAPILEVTQKQGDRVISQAEI